MAIGVEARKKTGKGLRLEQIPLRGFEKVVKATDEQRGLQAIICIHDTTLGCALGGTRIYPYASFNDALKDVSRLARGMTYKSALAQSGFGGGKSVIIADPKKEKTEELLLAFGEAVHALRGEYICAEDSGSTTADMLVIRKATPYIVGLPDKQSSGNPSPFTAMGTFLGIQASLKKVRDDPSVRGRTIAIQGLGSVGQLLAESLFWAGAYLIVTDVDPAKVQEAVSRFGAQAVKPEEIFGVSCDVFAPCAMGGILNKHSISRLRCKIVAGCANNQLLEEVDAVTLGRRDILYAPDFVINGGGLINVTEETMAEGYSPLRAREKVLKIYDKLLLIYAIAEKNRCSTHRAANELGNYNLRHKIGKRETPIYLHHSQIQV